MASAFAYTAMDHLPTAVLSALQQSVLAREVWFLADAPSAPSRSNPLARFTGPRKGAFLHAEVPRIVVYTLKQADDGEWSICRMGTALFTQMQLGPAIKLAREAVRNEHRRSGQSTCLKCTNLVRKWDWDISIRAATPQQLERTPWMKGSTLAPTSPRVE